MVSVWVLMEWGDDYHGSRSVGVYSTRTKAEREKKILESANPGSMCPESECDFQYWYTIHDFTVDE